MWLDGGEQVQLTEREACLLAYLDQHSGRVVGRRQLERDVWGYRASVRSKVVGVTIGRLRRKLPFLQLETVRGRGWRLQATTNGTRLVGREEAAETLRMLLERERWAAVTGPVGVGKTELVRSVFPKALVVRLDAVLEESEAWRRCATALDLPLAGDHVEDAVRVTIEGLEDDVVVLDGCDGVIEALVRSMREWSGAARLVFTCRARPAVVPAVHLAPLDVDDAVALFVRCAGDAGQAFDALDPLLLEVVAQLDGLPRAIELAAVRGPALGLRELRSGLEDSARRFELLRRSGESGGLDVSLSFSWTLLGAKQAEVLDMLSVFVGPFTAQDAKGILPGHLDPYGVLQELVEASLLWRRPGEGFGMLESTRAFARGRLERRGGLASAELAHARWFARLGSDDAIRETLRLGYLAREESPGRTVVELLAALRRLGASKVPVSGLVGPLCRALWIRARMDGPLPVAVRHLRAAVAQAPGGYERVTLWACLLEGERLLGEGRDLEYLKIGEVPLADRAASGPLAVLLDQAGRCWLEGGEPARAEPLFQRSLELHDLDGTPTGNASASLMVGVCRWLLHGDAVPLRKAHAQLTLVDHLRMVCEAEGWLARLELRSGHEGEGFARLRRTIRFAESQSDQVTALRTERLLCRFLLMRGRDGEGEQSLARLESRHRRLGLGTQTPTLLGLRGGLAALRGEREAAIASLDAAIRGSRFVPGALLEWLRAYAALEERFARVPSVDRVNEEAEALAAKGFRVL